MTAETAVADLDVRLLLERPAAVERRLGQRSRRLRVREAIAVSPKAIGSISGSRSKYGIVASEPGSSWDGNEWI